MKVLGGIDLGGATTFPLAKSAELITWATATAVWQAAVVTALASLGKTVPPGIPLSPTVTTTITKAV
jgi:hypothetical protein